jgi:hypothetical protein
VLEPLLSFETRSWASYVLLEARRNRLLYLAWPLVIVASLPFGACIASASAYPPAGGVSAAVLAWTVGGLPLTAVLFGAVAGVGLRGRAEEDDAALPLAPRTRALAALSAAAAALAFSAAVVGLLATLVFPDASWSAGPLGYALGSFALSGVMSLAFLGSFLLSNAVIGSAAGLLAGLAAIAPFLYAFYSYQGSVLALIFAAAGVTLAPLGALLQIVPRVSRSFRWTGRALALAAFLAAAGYGAAAVAMKYEQGLLHHIDRQAVGTAFRRIG